MTPLIGYAIQRTADPPPITAQAFEYLLGSNGLFVRGRREGLEACVPVVGAVVRGLEPVEPAIHLAYPRLAAGGLTRMLEIARQARQHNQPVEILFHLAWQRDHWQVSVPRQSQSPGSCAPLDTGPDSSFAHALIEVHSHHTMPAFWSPTDDRDECSGFRLYGVLGTIFKRPTLRLRVGMHGYFWEIPAHWVFELPPTINIGGKARD